MAEKKITKRDMFNEVIAMAQALEREDIVAFAEREIALLDKKRDSKSKAEMAVDTENARLMELVKATLVGSEGKTVTDIMKSDEELGMLSNQKVSALVRKMIEAGVVVKSVDKKKSIFSLK